MRTWRSPERAAPREGFPELQTFAYWPCWKRNSVTGIGQGCAGIRRKKRRTDTPRFPRIELSILTFNVNQVTLGNARAGKLTLDKARTAKVKTVSRRQSASLGLPLDVVFERRRFERGRHPATRVPRRRTGARI